ncbi:hypothetical protein [Croceimicrobium sp.]|uniref:hypothetical protein n=1 Tax=Croceimicrobium sp. TaxID=2828340 RepID=UPI003BA9E5D4
MKKSVLVVFALVFLSFNNYEESKVLGICDSDVFSMGSELYYMQPLELALLRPYFDVEIKKAIGEKLYSVFSSVEIAFIKTYNLDNFTFFESCVLAECGEIVVCGLYSPEVFMYQNFGNLTYVDFLFEGLRSIELGSETGGDNSVVIYGELIKDKDFHIFGLDFFIDLKKVCNLP